MPFDEAWSMPYENWQPHSSYDQAVPVPGVAPDAAPLVQLPCVNEQWAKYILGSLDQLRNPAAWDPSTGDTGLYQVLQDVALLRSMMSSSINVPCCSVTLRLTATGDTPGCMLQWSTDGGTIWHDTNGWSANFDGCVKAHIPPQVPANPKGATPAQAACNIAGFLAQDLLEKTGVAIYNHYNDIVYGLLTAQEIMGFLGTVFPITNAAINAVSGFVQQVKSQIFTAVQAAMTDPVLWSKCTCAIYEAIKVVGYVDFSNFGAAQTNLHNIVYPQAWAPPALGAYWGDLGLSNIQAVQAMGALDDVDCSECDAPNTWCAFFDFTHSDGGWTQYLPGQTGTYVGGIGWTSANSSDAIGVLDIKLDLPSNMGITGLQVLACTNKPITVAEYCVIITSPFSQICHAFGGITSCPGYSWGGADGLGPDSGNRIELYIQHSGWDGSSEELVVQAVQLRGIGPNPFPGQPCIVGP